MAKLLERAAAGVAAVWLGDVVEPCPNKRRLPSGNLLHSDIENGPFIVNI